MNHGHGTAAMEKVLMKKQLHREAIELILANEPSMMTGIVELFGEWEGKEEELILVLNERFEAQKTVQQKERKEIIKLRGKTAEEHMLIALECLQGLDITMRTAASRLLFARSSPHCSSEAHREAVHLINFIYQGSEYLTSHILNKSNSVTPSVARALALLSTV
eukprot:TRINITY_DN3212_c0_g1_i2.p1 TRINITY_DN3212_c0_g1~~TRINITY_DN3212_c0_g1_i2.p1  ORF type:complete len:164 (+),score=27.72 TRINITY_DN3212_c0_g1_i2:35-526(+)